MQKKLLIVFIIGTFVVGTAELIITGILELIASDLHVKESYIGQLITIYAVSFAIGAPVMARLTAKFERKKVLLISLFFFTAGNLLSALSHSYIALAVLRSLTAFAAAAFIVVTMATAARLAHPGNRGKVLGLVYMGFSAANVFGVPLGTFVGISIGWRMAFWLIVLSSVICFLLIAITLPTIAGAKNTYKHSIFDMLKNREVSTLLSITALLLAAHYIVYSYISPFMTEAGYSLESVSFILLVAGIAGTIGSWAGGSLTDLTGSKKTLASACLLFIGSILLLNASLSSLFFLAVIVFVWNFVMWATNPAIQSALITAEPEAEDLSLSLNMSALNIGIGLGALLGGIIVHQGFLSSAPFITAVLGMIPLLLLKGVKEKQTE